MAVTIRSVDMQVLVQKVGDVAKIKQAEQSSDNNRQQQFTQQINQDTIKYSKTVNQALPGEKKRVHDDKEDKEKRTLYRRKKGGKSQEKENNTENWSFNSDTGTNIDIKI